MCTFYMKSALEQNKNFVAAGNALYLSIKQAMTDYDMLSVDMEGVTSLPSIFLNASLGRIIDEVGKEKLMSSVGFVKITKQQAMRLRDYMQRYN